MIKKTLTILTTIALMAATPLSCLTVFAQDASAVEDLDTTTPLDGEEVEKCKVTFVVSFGGESQSYDAFVNKGEGVSVPGEIAAEIIVDDESYELGSWTDGDGNAVDLSEINSDMTVYASYHKAGEGENDDPAKKAEKKNNNNSGSSSDGEEESSSGSTTTTSTTVAATSTAASTVVAPTVAAAPVATATVKTAPKTGASVAATPDEEIAVAAPSDVIVGIDPEGEVLGPVERQDAEELSGAIAGPVAPAAAQTTEIVDGPVALAGTTGQASFPWWIVAIAGLLAAGFGGVRFTQIRKGTK